MLCITCIFRSKPNIKTQETHHRAKGVKIYSRNPNQKYENVVFQIPNQLRQGWTAPPILYLPWRSTNLRGGTFGMETLA